MSNYSKEDMELFAGILQELTGVSVEQLKTGFEYVQTQQRESAVKPLKDKWGDNYDYYLGETEKYYNSLAEDRRDMYNNPEGIEYLFNTHVQSMLPSVQTPGQQQPPGMERGLRSTALPTQMTPDAMSVKDINEMSDSDRAENWESIKATFAAQGQQE